MTSLLPMHTEKSMFHYDRQILVVLVKERKKHRNPRPQQQIYTSNYFQDEEQHIYSHRDCSSASKEESDNENAPPIVMNKSLELVKRHSSSNRSLVLINSSVHLIQFHHTRAQGHVKTCRCQLSKFCEACIIDVREPEPKSR